MMKLRKCENKMLTAVGYRIQRLSRLHLSCIKEPITKLGIPYNATPYLNELYSKDGISQEELSGKIFVDKSTVSKMLSKLEKMGFVIRVENKNDKREKFVYLTDKAIKLKNVFFSSLSEISNIMELGFNKKDLEKLYYYFNRIDENLTGFLEKQLDNSRKTYL